MANPAAAMLRKLRIKFIVLNMALAALVLGVSFAAICVANYQSTMDEVHQTLVDAVTRTGKGPHFNMNRGPLFLNGEDELQNRSTDGGGAGGEAGDDADDQPDWAPPLIGGEGDSALPIAVYYVTGSAIVQAADRSTATVPDDLLLAALPEVLASNDEWGYLPEENLYFAQYDGGRDYLVAFADGSVADGWQSLALTLAITGAGALVVLLGLNLLFSRWALRPVQQAWNQQQQFVADASHELKTPLTVILANNAILRERGNETIASQGQWIESTQMEAERMQGLVTDLLDLARADADPRAGAATGGAAGRDGHRGAPVNFSRLVEGEVLTFESVAFECGLTWESAVEPGVRVPGDNGRLERLVAVLLDNACKYTNPGGRVDVALTTDDKAAVLTVRNTGDPIPAEDLAHLFDRFYRVDKARTHTTLDAGDATSFPTLEASTSPTPGATSFPTPGATSFPTPGATSFPIPGGYGLGLAIAQDIAQAHKGTLGVTSTEAEGTTFTLRLPLA